MFVGVPCFLIPMKSALRQSLLAQRAALSDTSRAVANGQILSRLLALPTYQQATAVLGYLNFGTEFASELWVQAALVAGKRVALPRVNPLTNTLDLFWVSDLDNQLLVGKWGIREPSIERCERLNGLNEVEFALLPGVGFTRQGARLGYGGGFYDKLLARFATHPPLVAAAYALQVVTMLPQEATDIPVDCLVTELETLHCAA